MARFTRENLPNNVSAKDAWDKITSALKAGTKSVEVLARVVEGKDTWELRYWDGIRGDKSNAAGASPNKDY